jgi:hypothetical protein
MNWSDGITKRYKVIWDLYASHKIRIQNGWKINEEQAVKVTYGSERCRKKEISHKSNIMRGFCYSYTLKIVFLSNEAVNLVGEYG